MSDVDREQAQIWARAVQVFQKFDEMEARLTRPVTERMLALATVSPGMRVLDIAAGRGEPAIPAAHRVGSKGSVVAVDLVEGMLQIARERANREGLANIEFQVADAQVMRVGEKSFDVATLRWGLMYMRAPELALASIHRALKPGGGLAIASWVEPARVPYVSLPRRILERYRELPPLPGAEEPGTFRHADGPRFHAALEQLGYSVEASEEMEVPVVEAADGRGIVAWIREMGGGMAKLVNEMPQQQQAAWEDDLSTEMEKHRVGEKVFLGGVTRMTLARASPSR